MPTKSSDYEMYTERGNQVVEAAVDRLVQLGNDGKVTRKDLPEKIEQMCKAIARHHAEVYDTEPQYDIAEQINVRLCTPQLWQPISRWDW